jgi:TRAP-type uncharacterized transport system substrate-binding protein
MNVHYRSLTQPPAPPRRPLTFGDRLRRMLRHSPLILVALILAAAGIFSVVSYLQSKPVTLKIAVGPRQGEDYKLVQALASYLNRERAPVRLTVIRQDSGIQSAGALDAGKADLALVRRDAAMPKTGQVVAVHRRNVAVLVAPPAEQAAEPAASAAAKKKGRAARGAKAAEASAASPETPKAIEKVEDLHSKTIAIIGRTPANVALLHTILAQYGVPADKVTTLQLDADDVTAQLKATKFDALFAVGPIGSRITAEAVATLARGKEQPHFLEIASAEAIEQQHPVYEKAEIPSGAFGGSRPAEAVETIGVAHYIVARKNLDERLAGEFTRWLFHAKQAQGAELPAFTRIESPDTDKAASLAVHPGTLAYLEGEQTTFFERYSEFLYWGLMLLSFVGSGAAWLVSYVRTSPSAPAHRNDLEALIGILRRARTAPLEELDFICIEIDDIIERTIRQNESGALDQKRSAALTLAADQARRAVAERRASLNGRALSAPDRAKTPQAAG